MHVHLNGRIVPLDQARISPLDRGFLLADGLYEGLRAFDGRIVAIDDHIARLNEGLKETGIPWDASPLAAMSRELLEANNLRDAFLYWQITRGEPGPDQPPRARVLAGKIRPTVFGYAAPAPSLASHEQIAAKSAVTLRDDRWKLGHLKSIALMGNVLAAMEATKAKVDDAIFVRGDLVSEGTSTNLLAVIDGKVVTPDLRGAPNLPGVTRAVLLRARPEIIERPLRVEELHAASEIMLIGTLTMLASVTRLNREPVGAGVVGPAARSLNRSLIDAIAREKKQDG